MELSRDTCKVFKQNESSAQIIFRKALGVYTGPPAEQKLILSYCLLPSKCSHSHVVREQG